MDLLDFCGERLGSGPIDLLEAAATACSKMNLNRFCSGLLRAIRAIKGRTMRPTDMAAIHSDAFKRDAFRIAPTNGLTRHQVASDLWGRLSTPGKWVRAVSEEPKVPAKDAEPLRENEWLRKENRILIDLSRIRKPSGRLFSRRKSEGQKEMAMFFAAQKP